MWSSAVGPDATINSVMLQGPPVAIGVASIARAAPLRWSGKLQVEGVGS